MPANTFATDSSVDAPPTPAAAAAAPATALRLADLHHRIAAKPGRVARGDAMGLILDAQELYQQRAMQPDYSEARRDLLDRYEAAARSLAAPPIFGTAAAAVLATETEAEGSHGGGAGAVLSAAAAEHESTLSALREDSRWYTLPGGADLRAVGKAPPPFTRGAAAPAAAGGLSDDEVSKVWYAYTHRGVALLGDEMAKQRERTARYSDAIVRRAEAGPEALRRDADEYVEARRSELSRHADVVKDAFRTQLDDLLAPQRIRVIDDLAVAQTRGAATRIAAAWRGHVARRARREAANASKMKVALDTLIECISENQGAQARSARAGGGRASKADMLRAAMAV